ncbi:MAG: hypothetical protein CMC22_02055 [Flavobacteriaceae bacterium]|nr:hypothetical protein [Flavobacteriaceae bacterium]
MGLWQCSCKQLPLFVVNWLFIGQFSAQRHAYRNTTSRKETHFPSGGFPLSLFFFKKDFKENQVNKGQAIFGASKYLKDGLIPFNELMGAPLAKTVRWKLNTLYTFTKDFEALE